MKELIEKGIVLNSVDDLTDEQKDLLLDYIMVTSIKKAGKNIYELYRQVMRNRDKQLYYEFMETVRKVESLGWTLAIGEEKEKENE